ncbi:HAMP domain-containing sensor histidine kinase [Membranihabitans marinus]
MAVAIAGIVWMQVKWIKENIKVVENQFDIEVFQSLISVINEVENLEGGFDMIPELKGLLTSDSSLQIENWQSILSESDLSSIPNKNITFKQLRALIEASVIEKTLKTNWTNQDLTSLINLENLDNSIQHNLRKRGIQTDFHYGVFSYKENNFIIMDGNYIVFPDQNAEATITEHNFRLSDSKYSAEMFRDKDLALGKLIIEFPTRNRFIFNRIISSIILSVLFIAITLFSFLYTTVTILRQKHLSEMKTDFINNMTHEFKTPIATISLAVDSIQSPVIQKDPAKINRFTNIIRDENKRMLRQVEKVLQMALLNNRNFNMSLSEVDVHHILAQAKKHIELQIMQRGGQAELELNATDYHIIGDENHLSNIMHNLLDNANKYTADKPLIKISTWSDQYGLTVSIKDNGMGMTKEQQRHIFEKFYRAHTGNVHNVKGFGLGLSYVKAIVDAHKGEISVNSMLDKGSEFILFFPFENNLSLKNN